MTLLREAIGDSLRRARLAQNRTLREVSTSARVSLGYLSEVERGRKEASSELLAAICAALDVPLSRVLWDVSTIMAGADGLPTQSPAGAAAVPAEVEQTAAEGAEAAPAAAAPAQDTPAPEPALAPASAALSVAGAAGRPLPLAVDTRIVIPAPKADMLVLVKGM
ncbi:helix-turn-helix domain-containing protein [Nocardia brasiliensis]|uniref:helix-turn-helix domain-containing protein n=1 Tax=Nocardia brasiliensis TaxID=37326 RepID=UPI0004A6F5C9|nr:helix-turn-helix transcriptional regulator [Nocardia brasiliensis]